MKKVFALLFVGLFLLGCASAPTPTATPTPVATVEATATPEATVEASATPSVSAAECDQRLSLSVNDRVKIDGSPNYLKLKSVAGGEASLELQTQSSLPVKQFSLKEGGSFDSTAYSFKLLSLSSGISGFTVDVCINAVVVSPTASPIPVPLGSLKVFSIDVENAAVKVLPEFKLTEKPNYNPVLTTFNAAEYNSNYNYQFSVENSGYNNWPSLVSTPVTRKGVNGEEKKVLYSILSSGSTTWKETSFEMPCYGWKYYIKAYIKEFPGGANYTYQEYADKLVAELISICPDDAVAVP